MDTFHVHFYRKRKIIPLFEELTGARFTTSYTRIGGVARDIPEGWLDRVSHFCDNLPKAIDEVEKLLTRNRIFIDRTEGIGEVSKEDAIAFGLQDQTFGHRGGLGFEKISLIPDTRNMTLMFPSVPGVIAMTVIL